MPLLESDSRSPLLLLERSPLSMSEFERRLALLYLIRQLAYREGEFKLSSGGQTSYYINCKPVMLHPQGAYLLGQLMLSALPDETQAVAGLTLGADPLVSAVSLISAIAPDAVPSNVPGVIVRKQPKGHGTAASLEGPTLPEGSLFWILEDVVTTGASALKACDRVREAGYRVGGILAIVDRQEGGSELYRQAGIEFHSLFTISDVQAAA
ncbi:MAG: orotate phosphoribosyltransferase [Cyanobacteria bacterium P01_E01_bin.48]